MNADELALAQARSVLRHARADLATTERERDDLRGVWHRTLLLLDAVTLRLEVDATMEGCESPAEAAIARDFLHAHEATLDAIAMFYDYGPLRSFAPAVET